MRIKVTGYIFEQGCPRFEDIFFANTADEIHDIRQILAHDGVRIEDMQNVDTGEHYFTAGEVLAMGHDCPNLDDRRIWVYVSDGICLSYSHIF